jgi:hypothetical protein
LLVRCRNCGFSWLYRVWSDLSEECPPIDDSAILDLLAYSMSHSQEEAIAHFPMFRPAQVAALYRECPRTREALAFWILLTQEEQAPGHYSRGKPRARVLRHLPKDSSGWRENAIRCLEEGLSEAGD